MRTRFVIFLFIFIATSSCFGKTITIKMLNNGVDGTMVFEPGFVIAEIGDTIEFIPTDAAHGSRSILIPKGGKAWAGQLDQKVSTKVIAEGIYIYECGPHSTMGMVGVIQVGRPVNLSQAKEKAREYSKKLILNKSRLNSYIDKILQTVTRYGEFLPEDR